MSHFNFPLKNPSFSFAEAKSLGRLPNGGLDLVQAAGDVALKNIHSQVSGQFRENRERFFFVYLEEFSTFPFPNVGCHVM